MQTNLWNLKNMKERLGIREKTEAHKRHLISLVKAKSKIDDQNRQWKVKSLNKGLTIRTKQNIKKENNELVDRLCNIKKVNSSRVNSTSAHNNTGRKFFSITQNLRSMASITRINRIRNIQDQNAKIYNRLIRTSPTLSRQEWIKGIKENKQYKNNMSRTKYFKPDYSHEVTRIVKSPKPTLHHLKISKVSNAELPSLRTKNVR